MSETRNISSEESTPESAGTTANPPVSTSVGPGANPPGGEENSGGDVGVRTGSGLKANLKKVWGYLNAFLDYIDEEVPAAPRAPCAPESGLKKLRGRFNAFLDSLESEGAKDGAAVEKKTFRESVRGLKSDWRTRDGRAGILKRVGGFCWTVFFLGVIVVFLFVLSLYGTVKSLEFIDEHRVKFYPADAVMDYVSAEHETLEKTAEPLTTVSGKCEDIPLDRFDAKCREVLKPLKIYSDEYGVYIMTSRDWYSGEHGIFIARDADNMPPTLNWGWIEGRVYTYGIFD